MFVFSACSPSHKGEVDELNYLSYALHYRNLDSTKVLAEKALALSETILQDTQRLATTWLLLLLPRWITILPSDGLTR